jgi:hypothetical protein
MAIELAELIGQLRSELTVAMDDGEDEDLRFELGPVKLELTVAVDKEASPIPRRRSESEAPGGAADGNLPGWPTTGSVSGTAISSTAATTAWIGSCSTPTTRWATTRAGSARGGDGCTGMMSSWTTRT